MILKTQSDHIINEDFLRYMYKVVTLMQWHQDLYCSLLKVSHCWLIDKLKLYFCRKCRSPVETKTTNTSPDGLVNRVHPGARVHLLPAVCRDRRYTSYWHCINHNYKREKVKFCASKLLSLLRGRSDVITNLQSLTGWQGTYRCFSTL